MKTVEDILGMSQRDLKRLHIIRKAIEKGLKQREAASLLELSERQIRRLVRRIRKESDQGIVHRSRGKPSHHAIAGRLRDKVLRFCRTRYAGFNPTLASEKLFEKHKIKISRETLRQWFVAAGIAYDQRKTRPHRRWRERRAHSGQMVQMDGSHHDWFEGRREPCVLMGYIDDASSRVYARFYEYEGTLPAMDSFRRYALKYGLPQSVYLDRHATYKGRHALTIEEELANRLPASQFGRALEELGVHLIHAQSAPAKGRIERLFKTFQDRLVKEMRLKGVKTIPQGNVFLESYLPGFNRRFGVEPLDPSDLHRPLPERTDLDKILCVRTIHALRNDFTVVHEKKFYQIQETLRTKDVTVEERTNGSLLITHKGRSLRYTEIARRPAKIKPPRKIRRIVIPPKDHPWRHFRLPGSPQSEAQKGVLAGVL